MTTTKIYQRRDGEKPTTAYVQQSDYTLAPLPIDLAEAFSGTVQELAEKAVYDTVDIDLCELKHVATITNGIWSTI